VVVEQVEPAVLPHFGEEPAHLVPPDAGQILRIVFLGPVLLEALEEVFRIGTRLQMLLILVRLRLPLDIEDLRLGFAQVFRGHLLGKSFSPRRADRAT